MARIRYQHIFDTEMLKNLLIEQGLPTDEVARILGVPYNCLLNQIRKKFSKDEQALVRVNNKRRHWTNEEKKQFVNLIDEMGGIREVSITYGIHEGQLRSWQRDEALGNLDKPQRRGRRPQKTEAVVASTDTAPKEKAKHKKKLKGKKKVKKQ